MTTANWICLIFTLYFTHGTWLVINSIKEGEDHPWWLASIFAMFALLGLFGALS